MAKRSEKVEVEKNTTSQTPTNLSPKTTVTFPNGSDRQRLMDYEYNSKLFTGEHFEAFSIKVGSDQYTKDYSKLRYVMANFAGLLSKIMADMLFNEPVNIKVPHGDQEWVDSFVHENNLNVQLYESALTASSQGDALFKLRVAPRYPDNPNDPSTVIVDEVTPCIYFPEINEFNVKQDPSRKILAWKFKQNGETYLRQEIHSYGKIENKVFLMKGDEMVKEVGLDILGQPGLQPVEIVGIDECLLIHIPNWKTGSRYFGISDYKDLTSLFYAVNNRLTKIDNILDKHSDPILAVPTGILDENGQVKRSALNLFEVPDGTDAKPEYIVWNANLEAAFSEVDKLVETIFMISETSPDILGMGKGQAESGRALKLKLLRTIAKARRKRLYFDKAIKDIIYRAQLLAKEYNVQVGGKLLQGDAVVPEIEWQDGLPVDALEAIEIESKRVDAGLTTKKASIMRLDSVDEDTAEEMVDEIDKETKINMPEMNMDFTGASDKMNPNTKPPMPNMKQNQKPPMNMSKGNVK